MRRRLPPRQPEPPEGFMLFYLRVVAVQKVEEHARLVMGNFDRLPKPVRFALNCVPVWPHKVEPTIARYGDSGAAQHIINNNWSSVFKTPDGKGVYP